MIWKLIFFISWIGIFCLSLGGLILGVAPTYLNDILNYQYFRIILFSGSLFYFLLFFRKAYKIFKREEEDKVIIENDQGKIGMTVKSIENVIKKILKEKEFIKNIKVKVKAVQSSINTKIEIEIDPVDDLNKRIQEIQSLVRDYIKDVLGIEVNNMDVIVTKVHPDTNSLIIRDEVKSDE